MAATLPKPRRRTRATDPAGRLTLRLGKEQVAFLAMEAGKAGLATACAFDCFVNCDYFEYLVK